MTPLVAAVFVGVFFEAYTLLRATYYGYPVVPLFTPAGNSASSWRAFEVYIRAELLNFSRCIMNLSWSPVRAELAIYPALSRREPAPAPVTVLCPLAPVNIPIMFYWKVFFPPVGVFLAL